MVELTQDEHAFAAARLRQGIVLRASVWVLFGLLAVRFVAIWTNAFAETSLPAPGRIGFTLMFTSFSLAHATSQIGWRRAMAFLIVCAVVSWGFEEVGIATGRIYGSYHYGDQLGPKLGHVPLIIPIAWFMMIYASWVVARLLLEGAGRPAAWPTTLSRIVVASFAMTAWDTVMDPGMAPCRRLDLGAGVAVISASRCRTSAVGSRRPWSSTPWRSWPSGIFRTVNPTPVSRGYSGLPALFYAFIALDRLLLPDLVELRVVAAFGIGFVALLAVLRLALPLRA